MIQRNRSVSDLEDRVVKITPTEQKKEKKIFFFKNEDNLRDFWDNIKQTNISLRRRRKIEMGQTYLKKY